MSDKEEKVDPLSASMTRSVGGSEGGDLGGDRKSEELLSSRVRHREMRRGRVPFEDAYRRETVYLDRALKPRFEQLLAQLNRSKTSLINEAIADLLVKYNSQI